MSTSNFLGLPGEIRNQIYELLLVIPIHPSVKQDRSSTSGIHPQIMAASRQTHREASAILYGCNTFISNESLLTSMPRLRAWHMPVTAPQYVKMITRYHMHVRLDCDARFKAEAATTAFSGLDELTVAVWQAQYGSSGYEVLRLLEGVRRVKKATVSGSVTSFPVYKTWLEVVMMSADGVDLPEPAMDENVNVRPYDLWTVSGQ